MPLCHLLPPARLDKSDKGSHRVLDDGDAHQRLPAPFRLLILNPNSERLTSASLRDIHDSSELDAPSEKPPPLSERDPDYYPGGDFVDEMKNYTDAEEGFQGGFGDNMVKLQGLRG